MSKLRTYSELSELKTFKERYEYLKLNGLVGAETFGFARYLNQRLYQSYEWKSLRNRIILRDNGCDLGLDGYIIHDKAYIHHLNPITKTQILDRDPVLFDPENLITVSYKTHQAIHYCDELLLDLDWQPRFAGDTVLWNFQNG